jgi:hypothetical protein
MDQDRQNTGTFVASLPLYVACCQHMFIIDAPDIEERAWCQIERTMGYAMLPPGQPLYVIKGAVDVNAPPLMSPCRVCVQDFLCGVIKSIAYVIWLILSTILFGILFTALLLLITPFGIFIPGLFNYFNFLLVAYDELTTRLKSRVQGMTLDLALGLPELSLRVRFLSLRNPGEQKLTVESDRSYICNLVKSMQRASTTQFLPVYLQFFKSMGIFIVIPILLVFALLVGISLSDGKSFSLHNPEFMMASIFLGFLCIAFLYPLRFYRPLHFEASWRLLGNRAVVLECVVQRPRGRHNMRRDQMPLEASALVRTVVVAEPGMQDTSSS